LWLEFIGTVAVYLITLLAMTSTLRAQPGDSRRCGALNCGNHMELRSTATLSCSGTNIAFGLESITSGESGQFGQASALGADWSPVTATTAASLCQGLPHRTQGYLALKQSMHLGNRPRLAPEGYRLSIDSQPPSDVSVRSSRTVDLNQSIYYRNKLELSLDGGWLPINIPFVFDVFLGDAYNKPPLNYTLVPVITSLRWQMTNTAGPWIFRGNWDLTASAAIVVIPRGPESRYIAWIMGIRRNFVPRHGKVAPYFDGRVGLGGIDARGPAGVLYAQGQNFTFTVNMGSGVRYNFGPRYSISAGLNWMHISNLYLSQPKFANYGINVYGPMFGINMRLSKPRRASE
jgi:hypothetical protein